MILEVGWRNAQRVCQIASFLHVEAGSIEVCEQPFVHVHVKGVDHSHGSRKMLILWQNEGCSGIGSITMDSYVGIVFGHFGYGCEVVHGAGVGCADTDRQVVRL